MKFAKGYRLNEKALSVKITGKHIGEITKKSIDDCYDWFNKIKKSLSDNENKIAEGVIKEIKDRLRIFK